MNIRNIYFQIFFYNTRHSIKNIEGGILLLLYKYTCMYAFSCEYFFKNILTLHFPLTNGITFSVQSNLSYQCYTDVLYLNTDAYLTYYNLFNIVQLILATNLDD